LQDRAEKICIEASLTNELKYLEEVFIKKGYPQPLVWNILKTNRRGMTKRHHRHNNHTNGLKPVASITLKE
jgi:hypothetical protein